MQVERGQVTPVRVRLRPRMGRAGAWVTAGVAAGFLAGRHRHRRASGTTCSTSWSKDRKNNVLSSSDDRITRGKILYISSDIGYVMAAAFAGLATYYFLRDPLPDSEGKKLEPRDWTLRAHARPRPCGRPPPRELLSRGTT